MFSLIRLVLLITIAVFSLIVLGLGGHLLWGLAIATSVLTMLTVIPVLVIDHFRRGVFVSWTAVELGWLFVLMILWLSTGGVGASVVGVCSYDYEYYDYVTGYYSWYGYTGSYCGELKAITAFAWLNFFMMLALFVWTLIIAIRAHNSGNRTVWQSSAADYYGNSNVNNNMTPMTGNFSGGGQAPMMQHSAV